MQEVRIQTAGSKNTLDSGGRGRMGAVAWVSWGSRAGFGALVVAGRISPFPRGPGSVRMSWHVFMWRVGIL